MLHGPELEGVKRQELATRFHAKKGPCCFEVSGLGTYLEWNGNEYWAERAKGWS